jgi:hypothetical protein
VLGTQKKQYEYVTITSPPKAIKMTTKSGIVKAAAESVVVVLLVESMVTSSGGRRAIPMPDRTYIAGPIHFTRFTLSFLAHPKMRKGCISRFMVPVSIKNVFWNVVQLCSADL